jgi:hypothetical protein
VKYKGKDRVYFPILAISQRKLRGKGRKETRSCKSC